MSISQLHSVEVDVGGEQNDESYALLIETIAHSDELAFKKFYEATMPRVYAVALAITKSPDMAQDVVIDVFLQVWRSADKYDYRRSRPLTWLLIMCPSRAINAVSGRTSRLADWDPPCGSTTREEEPEQLLSVLEQECTIARALRQLSTTQRRLVDLSFFRGLSHGEIAATTDMPLGTVKTHIRKGLKTLESLLADGRSERN
jgi:RNA polymerase sigma-70 factor (ECF subfamily)